jgi:Putative phage metallopeptidase
MRKKRRVHPLLLRWQELPMRAIRSHRKLRPAWFDMSPTDSGQPVGEPFDFCAAIGRLVMDIAIHCPDFRHLQAPRILVTVTQARAGSKHGLQARVTPLRFPHGALTRMRRGVPYHIQRFFLGAHEYLYLMTFCLPRYLDQDFDQKMVTLFHELYHISPVFDGDLRRHDGRCQYHTPRQRDYDHGMAQHARAYLAGNHDVSLHRFLRLNFGQLQERHGAVTGIVVPRPKIIPLIGPHAPATAAADSCP